jgi:hypothetical protein
VRVELYVGGAWLNITGDVYTNNLITITRGKADEASRTDAGTCVFVLNNTAGRYSSRNPRSDLFGLIGRNTLVRVSIQPGGASGARLVRFVGEVSSWPPKWDTARYVTVSASAAGILRRLGQGATPLQSPMRREFTNPARTSIVAYWPMEDGSTAASFASALPAGSPLTTVTTGVKPAAYTAYAASDALPTLGDGKLTVTVDTYTVTGQTALRLFAAFPDTAPTADAPIAELTTSTGMRWVLRWESTGDLSVQGYNTAGTSLEYITHGGVVTGKRLSVGLDFTQSGSSIIRRFYFLDVDAYTLAAGGAIIETEGTVSGTFGQLKTLTLGGGSIGDVAIGHIAVGDATTAYASTGSAMIGYAGESALTRLIRLCGEEDIDFTYTTAPGLQSSSVGPQSVASLLDLLQEAVDADEGRLYEQRDALGLAVRPRYSLYTQTPTLTLDYAAGEVAASLEPVDDDQHVHNDITITRDGGSSARVVAESGPLSVQVPPNGVGRYAKSTTTNLFTDAACEAHAWWDLHLGTWDAPRYPSVSVEVHSAPHLADQVAAVDVGARANITHPPEFLPPETIELLVEGYTETLGVYTWDITFNASPGGPYLVATADDPDYGRADEAAALAAAATGTATTLYVDTTVTGAWTQDPAEFPLNVAMGGEVATVTAVGPAMVDSFARTTTNGWDTADTGQPWTFNGGSASDYAVSAGTGQHTLSSVNITRRTYLPAIAADFDVTVSVATSVIATGGSLFAGPTGRTVDAANLYMARLDFTTAQSVNLTIRKRVAAVETQLATYTTGIQHIAGVPVWVRFQGVGSTLRARAWAAGTIEPDIWHLTVTDTALTAAANIGTRSICASTNTNTQPVIRYDDWRLNSVQRFTVQRAANGISKAHPQGEALALEHTALAAL